MVTPLGFVLRSKRADEHMSVQHAPQLSTDVKITVTSTSFAHGTPIPDVHAGHGRGENVSPALSWSKVPSNTKQLLVIMEDIDVPMKQPILHVIALLNPTLTQLDEGDPNEGSQRAHFVPSRHGRVGYFGLRALPGHGIHRYWFHVYALVDILPTAQAVGRMSTI